MPIFYPFLNKEARERNKEIRQFFILELFERNQIGKKRPFRKPLRKNSYPLRSVARMIRALASVLWVTQISSLVSSQPISVAPIYKLTRS
jgi:hypothetical protein